MILGDSLLVMTSLAEKEGLKGKVQMIYLDPPYGIKFGSQLAGVHAQARREGRQGRGRHPPARADPAFRDTWELGIHSYLAYLRDRLVVARELLTETGSIFVQIGDENVHLVRSCHGRGVRERELRQSHHVQEDAAAAQTARMCCAGDCGLPALVCAETATR